MLSQLDLLTIILMRQFFQHYGRKWKDENVEKKITWNAQSLNHCDPRTKQCELEV